MPHRVYQSSRCSIRSCKTLGD